VKIISLRAENVKRLRAVEITPDGNTVVIAGRNAQGKSSVLDAIWMALAGAAGAKETSRPIRDGEKKASVRLDLGDLVVTRKWTEAGTTLEVAAADGAKYPSPQTVLDGLIGRLTFDPLAFAQQDPRRQRETLLEVVSLPFDPDEVAEERQRVYDERTIVNREVKRLEAQISGFEAIPDDTPDEEVSAVTVAAELADAQAARRARADLQDRGARAAAEVERLKEALAAAETELAELRAEREALPEAQDPGPIQERLAALDKTNAAVRAKQARAQLQRELAAAEKKSAAGTAKLEQIDRSTADGLAAAKMPLEGLSFDAENVLYGGIPLSQASAAERLRVSIAVAMALNPKVRVIRITDGSLLDSENLALIDEMAAEQDFQVWLEKVDETGTIGITIEDGMVVGAVSETAEAVAS